MNQHGELPRQKLMTISWREHREITRFDRIWLHLRCLYLDHKCRWHLAGVWREIRPWWNSIPRWAPPSRLPVQDTGSRGI